MPVYNGFYVKNASADCSDDDLPLAHLQDFVIEIRGELGRIKHRPRQLRFLKKSPVWPVDCFSENEEIYPFDTSTHLDGQTYIKLASYI